MCGKCGIIQHANTEKEINQLCFDAALLFHLCDPVWTHYIFLVVPGIFLLFLICRSSALPDHGITIKLLWIKITLDNINIHWWGLWGWVTYDLNEALFFLYKFVQHLRNFCSLNCTSSPRENKLTTFGWTERKWQIGYLDHENTRNLIYVAYDSKFAGKGEDQCCWLPGKEEKEEWNIATYHCEQHKQSFLCGLMNND